MWSLLFLGENNFFSDMANRAILGLILPKIASFLSKLYEWD